MSISKGSLQALALAVVLSLVSAGAAEAATKISNCGKITKPGSYVLVRNLPGSTGLRANGSCLVIKANHVTLDLGGYQIKGNGIGDTTNGDGIFMRDRKNVTIRNGTVRGFVDDGVADARSGGGGTGSDHRISNVRVIGNGGDGILLQGSGHSVTNSLAEGNAGNGISVPDGSTLAGNTTVNNGANGIFAGAGTSVTDNTANSNGSSGIFLDGFNFVDGNTAFDNTSGGISSCGTCIFGHNLGETP